MINNKHAYLIMAHHRVDLLQKLINALDHEQNDLYVHLDIKCKEEVNIATKHSKLTWIPRMNVMWGGYSQVQCEYKLLNYALKSHTHYCYYHMLTGACYPIKTNQYIFKFFQNNYGKEFIGFDPKSLHCYARVKNKFLFNEIGKPQRFSDKLKVKFRNAFIQVQNMLRVDLFKKFHKEFKKGLAYWSITEEFAQYVSNNEELIKRMLYSSICGDEVFMQTLVYNSEFKNRVYKYENEYESAGVFAGWGDCVNSYREGPNLMKEDFIHFSNPNFLYALKFEGDDGLALINRINEEILSL